MRSTSASLGKELRSATKLFPTMLLLLSTQTVSGLTSLVDYVCGANNRIAQPLSANYIAAICQLSPATRHCGAERQQATVSGAIIVPVIAVAEQHPAAKNRQRHWYLAP
jgi:hypothetical protein